MKRPSWDNLIALGEIASRRSFREAADSLGMTRSALSHAIRALESDLGVRLLHRTTRSVSPTPEGQRLLAGIGPLLRAMDEVLSDLTPSEDRLRGILRINGNEAGIRLLLADVVPRFIERYPLVELDLAVDDVLVDIVDLGFDAGVRLRNAVPADMIAVPLSPPVRFLTVASPSYLAKRPQVVTPESLRDHDCIRHRLPSGKRYRWEFERNGIDLTIDAPGQLTLNSNRLMVDAAVQGMGIAYVPDFYAETGIEDGLLETVLEDWCPAEPGLALYYSGHRQVPAVLRAFIDLLKEIQRPLIEFQE